MTFALLLFPASADLAVTVIGGYTSESEAETAGDAAELDPYFDHYLVIPAPPQTASLNVNQGGGDTGGGGGGGQER